MDFEEQLATAMRSSVETLTPPVTDLVTGGLARGQRRRRRRLQTTVALVAVVALGGAGAAVLNHETDNSSTTAVAGSSCHSVIRTGVLPTWARDGFSDAAPAMPHVLSTRGNVTAILFGTLTSPPAADHNNKILWVSQVAPEDAGPLLIDAVRAGTTRKVRREVPGGPGPSIIDLPQPGCWHITLRWGDYHDTIDLAYRKP